MACIIERQSKQYHKYAQTDMGKPYQPTEQKILKMTRPICASALFAGEHHWSPHWNGKERQTDQHIYIKYACNNKIERERRDPTECRIKTADRYATQKKWFPSNYVWRPQIAVCIFRAAHFFFLFSSCCVCSRLSFGSCRVFLYVALALPLQSSCSSLSFKGRHS